MTRFLEQFDGAARAEAVDWALRALRARSEPDRVLMCELAWEIHAKGYWSQLKRDDGSPYDSEETYFREALGSASWRTAYKRLAIGRMLSRFEESQRVPVRRAVAEIGVAKAAIIAPAVERTGEWKECVRCAQELSCVLLQARVSAALQAAPRGHDGPPGERFRRDILASMPDIDAMELVERFFEVGAHVLGSPNPIGIFLAGCGECLGE